VIFIGEIEEILELLKSQP